MNNFLSLSLLFSFAIILSLTSCQKKTPLDFTFKEVPDQILTYHRPIEFTFNIDKKGKYDIYIDCYYLEDKLTWDGEFKAYSAPLFLRLTGPGTKDIHDFEHMFTLMDGLGWRGGMTENEKERHLYNPAMKGVEMQKGKYTLAIFSNAKDNQQEYTIHGVSKLGMALKAWK